MQRKARLFKTCTNLNLTSIQFTNERFQLTFTDLIRSYTFNIITKYLIYCGGRFGPYLLNQSSAFKEMTFKRLEVGFRIQQSTEESFFVQAKTNQLDPKFRFINKTGDVEWRSFCACKDGEIVLSNTQGVWCVSGRSDCAPTGVSHIGFLTRILSPELALKHYTNIKNSSASKSCYFNIPIQHFLKEEETVIRKLDESVGTAIRKQMHEGFQLLAEKFPSLRDSDGVLVGPVIEGVAHYPVLDDDLKVPQLPCWIAGDSCGKFRGIVAAMVSGFYVGEQFKSLWDSNHTIQSSVPSSDKLSNIECNNHTITTDTLNQECNSS